MARGNPYRVEDKMTQWILFKALDYYLQHNPLSLTPIEYAIIQEESNKLSKLLEARIHGN